MTATDQGRVSRPELSLKAASYAVRRMSRLYQQRAAARPRKARQLRGWRS
jgi:hypothetical protein